MKKSIPFILSIAFILSSFSLIAGSFTNTTLLIRGVDDCVNNHTPITASLTSDYTGYNLGDTLQGIFNYGDGNTDTVEVIINGNMDAVKQANIHSTYIYTLPGTYSIQAFIVGPDLVRDSTVEINAITRLDSCGNIKGRVYNDYNSDCDFNGNDEGIANTHVLIKKNGEYIRSIWTDSLGVYSIDLPDTTYVIELYDTYGTSVNCPTSGSYTVSTFPSVDNDFSLVCNTSTAEFSTILMGASIPGITTGFHAKLFNALCLPANGTIKLVFEDSLLSYFGNPSAGATVNGDTVSWDFSGVSYYNWELFSFTGRTDTTAIVGDTVCLKVIISSPLLSADTVINVCIPVRSSFDPNDIAVHPIGVGSTGRILANTDLTYTIRFQNTGNHQAYNIYILDTLDMDVYDLSSLQILGSSHEVVTSLISPDNNVLRFRFDDINLPDSISDEEGSQGWVTYKIKQKVDLPKGTKLENSAAIYFDYNPPIYTNTVLNTIDDRIVGIDKHVEAETPRFVQLYPNPASEVVYVEFNGVASANYDVTVYNINGQKIRQLRTNKSLAIDVSSLAKGLYFVEVQSKEGERQISKLIINR